MHGIISSKSILTLSLFLEFSFVVLKFLSNTNIFNKDVDHKSHLRVRVSLTQFQTFPEFSNIATYMQENLCFCRKGLSSPSNTLQAMSESCGEKFN